MSNTKKIKKSLLLSVLSLVICCSMLLGTTFAWFTDSVSSANNIIKSGNLDVKLEYLKEGEWVDVEGASDILTNKLWEPGATEVAYLRVKNAGSLALQYQLGINIVSETKGVNALGNEFKLSDYIYFDVIESTTQTTYTTREAALAAVDGAEKISEGYTKASAMTAGQELYLALVVYMPETVGNEANHNGVNIPQIDLGISIFATQVSAEADSFDEYYDKDAIVFVETAAEAQAALDNAAAGTTIKLAPGVDYGTLYLRPYDGSAATKTVDWIGNNYGWETYTCFEDLTIIGAPGATVNAIEVEGGTYYYTEHSQDDQYPVMLSLVELKNVVIDGVTFTGKGGYDPQGHGNVINLSGGNIKVDGLTLKNCVLNAGDARLLYKTEATTNVHKYAYNSTEYTFSPSLKDITVTGCTLNSTYMGMELRETENVTITNNVFNVGDRNILLAVNTGCTYSGNITITGNVSNNAKERFVRADGTGDAVVVIKDNTLNAYMGEDADYIKVTNGNNVTVENNILASVGAADTAAAQKALDNAVAGTTIQLQPGVNYGTLYIRPTAANVTNMSCTWIADGCNCVTSDMDEWLAHMASGNHVTYYTAEINNVTIVGAEGATVDGFVIASSNNKEYEDVVVGLPANSYTHYDSMNINDLTFKDVAFVGKVNIHSSLDDVVYDGVTFDGCSFNTNNIVTTDGQAIRYYSETNNGNVKNLVVKNCTFTNCYQGVYTQNVYGVTVTGCTFDTTGHNAIANHVAGKIKVVITDNTFKNIGDRVIRFGEVGADSDITIQNNVATNSGDDDGEVMKATSIASGVVTSIKNNDWGTGTVVVNAELQDQ